MILQFYINIYDIGNNNLISAITGSNRIHFIYSTTINHLFKLKFVSCYNIYLINIIIINNIYYIRHINANNKNN